MRANQGPSSNTRENIKPVWWDGENGNARASWLGNCGSGGSVHLRSFGATVDNLRVGLPTVAHAQVRKRERRLEAPPGFEPGVEVLQTSALPLGDGAPK